MVETLQKEDKLAASEDAHSAQSPVSSNTKLRSSDFRWEWKDDLGRNGRDLTGLIMR